MSDVVDIEELKKQFLECKICNKLFDNTHRQPRVLPCLHSYCYTCLKKLIEQSKYKCPHALCKYNFYIENVSIDAFPKDNTRTDLLDFVRAGDHKSVILCETCKNKEKAISRCKDCSRFICDSCNTAHANMMIFSDHEVFTLKDFELSMDHICEYRHAEMCSIHDKEKLTLFCDGPECQTPMCETCFITSHIPTDSKKHMPTDSQKHVKCNIEKVYTKKVKNMMEKKDKIFKKETELVELSKRIHEQLDRFAVNSDTLKDEIHEKFEKAVKMLECRRDLLIENTDRLTKEKINLLKEQDTEIFNFIETIRDACRFLDQTVATKNQSAFLLLLKTISDRFNYLQDSNFDTQPRERNFISFTKEKFGHKFERFVDTFGNVFSSFGPKTKVTFPTTIETDKDFDIIIELFDNDDAPVLDKTTITCVLFETAEAPLPSVGELKFNHIGNGNYKTSCKIMDTFIQRIIKVGVMMNGRDFYVVELETIIEIKPKEVQTNGLCIQSENQGIDDKLADFSCTTTNTTDYRKRFELSKTNR